MIDHERRMPEPLGAILPSLVAKWKRRCKNRDNEIQSVWKQQMPQDIQQHAHPMQFQHGVLTVEVDSSVWMQELSGFRQQEIMDEMNQALTVSKIRDIRFRISS